jgi:hypothetical protein
LFEKVASLIIKKKQAFSNYMTYLQWLDLFEQNLPLVERFSNDDKKVLKDLIVEERASSLVSFNEFLIEYNLLLSSLQQIADLLKERADLLKEKQISKNDFQKKINRLEEKILELQSGSDPLKKNTLIF